MMHIEFTERGFARAEFTDRYGSQCSIQESSLATEAAIWLGVYKDFEGREATRMHLTQEMAAELIPLLQRFVETGELRPPPPPDTAADAGEVAVTLTSEERQVRASKHFDTQPLTETELSQPYVLRGRICPEHEFELPCPSCDFEAGVYAEAAADAGEERDDSLCEELEGILDELAQILDADDVDISHLPHIAKGRMAALGRAIASAASAASAADASPRGELGRELIAWAADERRTVHSWGHEETECSFCGVPEDESGPMNEYGGHPIQHDASCLHLRARALEAEANE